MNRLLVALLAAVDALIAAAVGVAVALAPLTVFWVLGLGGAAEWGALWPASVRIWQFGQLVPLQIALPPEYLTATGIPADAASFWLSLAPLAFAGGTAVFAARSGARAARAGAWVVGVGTSTVVTAAIAWLLWRSSAQAGSVAAVYGWQALVLPTLVFAVPALLGAIVGAWRHGDDGLVDTVRNRVHRDPRWSTVAEASARGIGIAALGFIGVGALLVTAATVLRGGEVVALFEAAHVDAMGATMLAIGQLAYLPTLVVWGGAFAAGPGFALGTGTAVTPAGTNLGVLPGLPALGIVPESVSHWMLLSVLLIVAVGFVAGAAARSRLGDISSAPSAPGGRAAPAEASAPRAVALAAIVVGGGAAVAILAWVASGAMGPGRLAEVGPAPGPVAFAVGVELLVGAAIALFTPTRGRAVAHGDEATDASPGARLAPERAPWVPIEHEMPDESEASAGTPAAASVPSAPSPLSAPPPPSNEAATQPFAAGDLDPLATIADPADGPDPRA